MSEAVLDALNGVQRINNVRRRSGKLVSNPFKSLILKWLFDWTTSQVTFARRPISSTSLSHPSSPRAAQQMREPLPR
jgi:hypothetical protein